MLSPANSNNLIIPPPAERVGKIIAEVISKTFDSDLESPLGSPHFGNGYVPRFGELAKAAATQRIEEATIEINPERIDIRAECEITEEFIRSADKEFLKVLENIESGKFESILSNDEVKKLEVHIKETRDLIIEADIALRQAKQNNSVDNFHTLNKAIENLKGKQETILSLFPPESPSPKFKLLNELSNLLIGLTGMLWSLLLELGILSAATPFVTWIPFMAGVALIVGRASNLVKIHIFDREKIQDKKNLLSIYESLIDDLEKEEKEMYDTSLLSKLSEITAYFTSRSENSTSAARETNTMLSNAIHSDNEQTLINNIAKQLIESGLVNPETSANGLKKVANRIVQAAFAELTKSDDTTSDAGGGPLSLAEASAVTKEPTTPVIDQTAIA